MIVKKLGNCITRVKYNALLGGEDNVFVIFVEGGAMGLRKKDHSSEIVRDHDDPLYI